MLSLRDLPHDIIKYEIFPYFDSNTRLIANDVLAPSKDIEERCVKKIKKDDMIAHDMYISTQKLIRHLEEGLIHYKKSIPIFRIILHGSVDSVIIHNKGFRNSLINKCIEFSNTDEILVPSKGYLKGIKILMAKVLDRTMKLPIGKQIKCKALDYSSI